MSEQSSIEAGGEAERKMTVFAPRIPVSMRQDIEAIQSITGQSVNDVGVEALTLWLETKLADETLGAQALAEIDAEEQRIRERRAVLENILGRGAAGTASKPEDGSPTRRTKTTKPADDAR